MQMTIKVRFRPAWPDELLPFYHILLLISNPVFISFNLVLFNYDFDETLENEDCNISIFIVLNPTVYSTSSPVLRVRNYKIP